MRRSTALTAMAAGVLVLCAAIALGPRARLDEAGLVPVEPGNELEAWLAEREAAIPGIRPGDAKGIVWADPSAPGPTDRVLVYLHGFSADRHELSPTVERVAAELGANAFFTRLAGHGRDGPPLGGVEASDWLRDVDEALAVAQRLGSRVVLVGASTGGTLAIWAAAREPWRDRLEAVVLVSPNFGPRDPRADMVLWPWGGLLARVLVGPERCFEPVNEGQARHWTTCYPTRALLPMMALTDGVRDLDLGRVQTPLLLFRHPDDQVVDPVAMEAAFHRLGSPRKEWVTVEDADDPAHHVLSGDILSPGATDEVVRRIVDFIRSLP